MIAITAKTPKGFYRCGAFHPPKRTLHADDKFTAEQLAVLKNEPMLVVETGIADSKAPAKQEAEGAAKEGAKKDGGKK